MAPPDPIPNSEVTVLVHPCTHGISKSLYVKRVSAGGKERVGVLLFYVRPFLHIHVPTALVHPCTSVGHRSCTSMCSRH